MVSGWSSLTAGKLLVERHKLGADFQQNEVNTVFYGGYFGQAGAEVRCRGEQCSFTISNV